MHEALIDLNLGYRALALAERAAVPRNGAPAKAPAAAAATEVAGLARLRLAQWRELSPFRSDDVFARRLSDVGLDAGSFVRLLAEPAEDAGARLSEPPAWLVEVAAAFAEPAAAAPEPFPWPVDMRDDSAVGFVELVRPLVDRARARLHAGIERIVQNPQDPRAPFTAEEADRLVSETLGLRLLPLLARTLVLEMHVARLQGELTGETAAERFAAFVDRLRQPAAAAAILNEYPVLARLVVEELETWVATSLELLERLAADWPDLVATFFAGQDPGPLTALDGGAGDRHGGGRAVRIATFSSGAKLVYKPRSLAVDGHFQELLAWLESRGGPSFRRLAVLDRGEYGWMEFVAAGECASAAEVELYHRRLGGLLAVLYALEATDCHFENLIAAGGQPVVVDLESLFHPRIDVPPPPQPDERLAGHALAESVLRIGLLPFRVGGNDELEGVDLSGVAVVAGQPSPQPVLQWQGIGTDEMRATRERVAMEGGSNRPSLDGREVEAGEYTEDMATGFAEVYRLLARHREELLAPGGLVARFADDPVRAVLRATRVYGLLLGESFHPDVLRDALDRDLLFDRLWLGVEEVPALARVAVPEHCDLRSGDIPSFTARPSSNDLWTSRGERIPGFFRDTALAGVRRRLQGLSEEDLRRQLALLRLALGTQLLNRDDVGWQGYAAVDPGPPLAPAELRRRLVTAACAVGEWFADQAIRDEEGHATWIGLEFRNRLWSMVPAPEDLYAGLPGIALFLAYLGAVTGEARWAVLSRAAMNSLLARFEEAPATAAMTASGPEAIGAFSGWGGILYAATHLGSLWQDPDLLATAERLAEKIPPRIASDEDLDVVGGAAGAILGLLALHRAAGSRRALAVAGLCGERLLARSVPAGSGLGWLTRLATERPQIGFSHGSAGIGFALVELGATAGDAGFLAAGLAAYDWEREAFWPELRRWLAGGDGQAPPPESTVAMAWCYGAPGVGLARLKALAYVQEPRARLALREEVTQAVQETVERGFGENHCQCHGDLGNLDFLLQAWEALGDPALDGVIDRQTRIVLASIARDGWLCGTRGGVESPGLMNGFAGIGYGLLRLADPGRVPSVLTLEPPPGTSGVTPGTPCGSSGTSGGSPGTS
ncbi:MAG TPA: type 2 lanthipeptide synthetase LanM family protein [Thermoanaerobaculia bacterium]|nr:type 2 lanthipeptide synthetase LanM family protein [Thermoanaerobaculia bacterium]